VVSGDNCDASTLVAFATGVCADIWAALSVTFSAPPFCALAGSHCQYEAVCGCVNLAVQMTFFHRPRKSYPIMNTVTGFD
jgi:hypothetical protein